MTKHWYSNTYGINCVDGDMELHWYDQWEQLHKENVPNCKRVLWEVGAKGLAA